MKKPKMTDPQSQSDENAEKTENPAPDTAEDKIVALPVPSLEEHIADLEKQLAEMKDRVLREMADAENTRRRAQKDREETSKYAISGFAKEILVISDNFHRALEAAPTEHSDPVVKNLIVGIDATERQLLATLERFGIKKIDPLGQVFDPHFHRVMMEIDAPDKPAGTIVQVIQAGYMIHDRLLREASVAVAKGAPSAAPVDTTV
ncbi:MAG: nucleotide exchange factor GrpE [Bdellovibrionales bacterium]